jgi:hypothetical protein
VIEEKTRIGRELGEMERWAVVVAVDLLSPPPIVSGVEPQAATEGGTSTVPGERQAITVGKQVPVPYFT